MERLRFRTSSDSPELRAAAAYVPIATRNLDPTPEPEPPPRRILPADGGDPWTPPVSRPRRRPSRDGLFVRAFTTSAFFLAPPLLVVLVARIAQSLYGT